MRTLALAIAVISSTASACPNLAGKYATCRTTTGATNNTIDMIVTQTETESGTAYTFTSTDETQESSTTEAITDGQPHSSTQMTSMGEITMTSTFKCTDDMIIGEQTASVHDQVFAKATQQFRKNGNALEMEISGIVFGKEFEDKVICE